MNTQTQRTAYLTQAAVIAAAYTILTMIAAGFDLASGAVQVRFSEALTILPRSALTRCGETASCARCRPSSPTR